MNATPGRRAAATKADANYKPGVVTTRSKGKPICYYQRRPGHPKVILHAQRGTPAFDLEYEAVVRTSRQYIDLFVRHTALLAVKNGKATP